MSSVRRNVLFLMTLFITLLTPFYLIWITLHVPVVGLSVEKDKSGQWHISHVTTISWANQRGIKIGETVTSVNGGEPGNHPTIRKYNIVENVESFEVVRNGSRFTYRISKDMPPDLFVYHTLVPTVAFIVFLAFSLFLYTKKREDKSAIILILFLLAVGLSYLSAGGSARGDSVARFINGMTFLFIPVLFLHFLYHYYGRLNIRLCHSRLLPVLYGVNGALIFINGIFIMGEFGKLFSVIRISQLALFSISTFICLYTMLAGCIRYRKTMYEPVLKLMVAGLTVVFFPFIGLVAIPKILGGAELIPGALAAVFLILLPVFLIYLVTANRLLDIDFVIHRLRYYSLLSLFPTAGILLLLYLIDREFTLIQRIQSFIVIYLGIIIFFYIKEELDFRFRPKLFKEKYNFQASLDRFSYDIAKVMKIPDLEERLIAEVREVLPVKSVGLFEMDLTNFSISIKKGSVDSSYERIANQFKQDSSLISVGEYKDLDDGIVLMVGEHRRKCYLLWIGEKRNRVDFNQNEKVWLKTIAHYTSIVYENLHLVKGIIKELEKLEESVNKQTSAPPWILRLLFNLSEKERRRLASDLHDSALQDQLLWYRQLEMISSDPEIPSGLTERLDEVKEGFLDVIHQIRETCNELRPPFLKEKGMVEALEDLSGFAQLRSDYVVHFHADFNQDLDYDHILAIYRIVQELLTNASKHSKATLVHITLGSNNESIYLNYRDNGVGMDLSLLQPSFQHMGLSGVKERVLSLEGEIHFHSTVGEGLEVSICIPVTPAAGIYEPVV
jgi:two-component system, NarL family, sensor histidine kinase ComP